MILDIIRLNLRYIDIKYSQDNDKFKEKLNIFKQFISK